LARDRTGPGSAVLASGFWAVSLFHLEWSRRADFYGLLSLFSVLSAWAFLRAAEAPRRWGIYALVLVVFLHAHPYALLAGVLHALALPWVAGRGAFRGFAAAWAVAGAAFLPWLCLSGPALLDPTRLDYRAAPGTPTLSEFFLRAPLLLAHGTEAAGLDRWGAVAPAVVAVLFGGCYLASLGKVLRGPAPPLLRLAHLAVPFGLAACPLVDIAYRYYFAHRQLLWIQPFYLLAVADGAFLLAGALARSPARRGALVGLAFAALALGFWVPDYLRLTWAQSEAGRGLESVAGMVSRASRPGDVLSFADEGLAASFLYHLDRRAFTSGPGFGLRGGRVNLRLAEGASATPVGAEVRAGPGRPVPGAAWVFSGPLDDLRVVPPLRRRS